MPISSIHSPLYPEISWVYNLIMQAVKPTNHNVILIPPTLEKNIAYTQYIEQINSTLYERIILALAHCFQLTPILFSKLHNEEMQNETCIDSYGLLKNNTTNLIQPTVHTANWLCEVYEIETQFLDEHHFFFQNDIIVSPNFTIPIFNSPLIFTKKAQYLFFGEIENLSEDSNEIAAKLLNTNLEKENLMFPDISTRIKLWNAIFSEEYSIPNSWVINLANTYKLTGNMIINVLHFVTLYSKQTSNEVDLPIILEGIRREYHKMGETMPAYKY